jgi:hypothetical protein
MSDDIFPAMPIIDFAEYIEIAYAKAENSLSAYGVSPDKFALIPPLYKAFMQAETAVADPDTATPDARRTRDAARKALMSAWRKFLNKNIRSNPTVSAPDLEMFGITGHDAVRTQPNVPDAVPRLVIRQAGVRKYEIEVINSETGKKKKPRYAAGSVIYLSVTKPDEPQHGNEYHKMDFAPTCRHMLEFPPEQLAMQACIYARYTNTHGKEGPEGIVATVIIC